MIKRIMIALALLALGVAPALAQTGTPKSKAALQTEINTNLPDNTTGLITPAILRTTVSDMLASWQQYSSVNTQTAANYTVTASDYGQLVSVSNAGAIAITLPQATGSFQSFSFFFRNTGATTATITPITSTINGAASLAVVGGQAYYIVSDGTNYQATPFSSTTSIALNNNAATTTLTVNNQVASSAMSTLVVNQDWSPVVNTNLIATFTSYGDLSRFTIRSAGGTQASPTATLSSGFLGNIGFRGFLSTGVFAPSSNATILAIAAENFTGTNQGTNLAFGATPMGVTAGNFPMAVTGTGVSIQINGTTNLGITSGFQADSLLTINGNTAASSTPPLAGTYLHIVGADGVAPIFTYDGYGVNGAFLGNRANGTNAAKTTLVNNNAIFAIAGQGWDGSAYGAGPLIQFYASETWSTTAHGNFLTFAAVANTTTNRVEILKATGTGVGIGSFAVQAHPAPDSLLTINANTAATVAPTAGTNFHIVGADGGPGPYMSMDSFGAGFPQIFGRAAAGTLASKSAVVLGQFMFAFGTQGWDGTTYGNGSAVVMPTSQLWTSTAHGSEIRFYTVVNGTTGAAEAARIQNSGGLSVGSANVATDPGNGKVVATGMNLSATFSSAPDALLTLNGNSAASTAAPLAGTFIHVVGTDTVSPLIVVDSFNAAPLMQFRYAAGSNASKAAVGVGNVLLSLVPQGWDGSAFFNAANVQHVAAENWTGSAHGSYITFRVIPLGATAPQDGMRATASSGLSVGSANTATDPGNGIVLATGTQSVATTVGSLGTCNTAAKGTRKFVTDSNAASFTAGIGAIVAAGGTTNVPVTCDGTNWRIG